MPEQRKVAWIVGGGSGIGAAVAQLLAKRGWTVAISGRRIEKLQEVATGLPGIKPYPLDVTDAKATAALTEKIASELGGLDLLVYGAAAWQPMDVGDYDFEKFQTVVDTNLLGAVRVLDPVVKLMTRARHGHIAVISSLTGYFGWPRSAAYTSTKAALISLTQAMRVELADKGILVQMIAPGFVESELTAKNDFPMPLIMTADAAAERIVHGLLATTGYEIAFPRRVSFAVKVVRLLPYPVFFWLMRKLLPKAKTPA